VGGGCGFFLAIDAFAGASTFFMFLAVAFGLAGVVVAIGFSLISGFADGTGCDTAATFSTRCTTSTTTAGSGTNTSPR